MSVGPLAGKLALVTGAGSGIGRAVSQLLARDGAKVITADRNLIAAQKTAADLKTDCLPLELNVSQEDQVESAVQKITKHFQMPATIVVNCAGITRDNYLLKMSEQDFSDVMDINLKGTFIVTQKCAQAMIDAGKSQGGSIINLSSVGAIHNYIGQCNYAASKSGVISLTRVAAKEFGKFGIRVNAVLPGYINTPMTANLPEAIKQQGVMRCPLQRYGEAEEVAEVISFLATERASYVNGAAIEVSGGLY